MASVLYNPDRPPQDLEPTEVYRLYRQHGESNSPIRLRIAAGGAGQSGLIQALALAFLEHRSQTSPEEPPFAVAWYVSDTSMSFNSLALRAVDLSITYHPVAEEVAMAQGIADRREYAYRDHFLLVGPVENPAQLPTDGKSTIHDLFKALFRAAVSTQSSTTPVRFLSRYDKSASNIKESSHWTAIGQTPWSFPYSIWYHQYIDFPLKSLEVAAQLAEYTLTDWGTWHTVQPWIRQKLFVFKLATDDHDDPLLNPAHLLVSSSSENKILAHAFADWMVHVDGGQEVIKNFTSSEGVHMYTVAP